MGLITIYSNTQALKDATTGISYTTLESLEQGTAVLQTITSSAAKDPVAAKTLDMQGREAAVDLMRVKCSIKSVENMQQMAQLITANT